ncbi:hypothetical protein G6F52_006091 [Rhizopus delemar]|nr:hypothetical protein G6F52_006091 [Rhizopus delemar]
MNIVFGLQILEKMIIWPFHYQVHWIIGDTSLIRRKRLKKDRAASTDFKSTLATFRSSHTLKKIKTPCFANDNVFIEGYRQSFGTIVGRFAKCIQSEDNKPSYFKTMGMNNIMDLSDNSDNSQLFQINSSSQTHLKHVMNGMSNEITFTQQEYNCESFERIIKKHKYIENEDTFLNSVISEIDDMRTQQKTAKRIYLQILETMLYDKYLYEKIGCSEQDFVVKI